MVKKKYTKRRSSPRPRVKARRSAGKKSLFGGLNLKSIVFGAGGLMVAQRFQPFGGEYKPALDKIATGTVLSAVHMGNHDLLTAGIKEAAATFANDFIGGGGGLGVAASQGDLL